MPTRAQPRCYSPSTANEVIGFALTAIMCCTARLCASWLTPPEASVTNVMSHRLVVDPAFDVPERDLRLKLQGHGLGRMGSLWPITLPP
jgi:hypothetical protein